MVKIGILGVDGIRSALNILGARGQADCAGIECERQSLLVPKVRYTIPEIMVVAVLNMYIRQWSIESSVAKVYSLFQILSITYGFTNERLYLRRRVRNHDCR